MIFINMTIKFTIDKLFFFQIFFKKKTCQLKKIKTKMKKKNATKSNIKKNNLFNIERVRFKFHIDHFKIVQNFFNVV